MAAGNHQQARTSFEDAADLFARCGAPFEHGRARLELARSLAALGRRDAAEQEIKAALAAFRALGAVREMDRAAALLTVATSQPVDAAAVPGPSHLTGRESEVLRLIAQGLSDKGIAGRLHLSEHTVQRHVSNILTKLDLPSRSAAAAYAVRHDPLDPAP